MSDSRDKSSEALYRLVCNSNLYDWIRREALQGLIDRKEVRLLELIVNNGNLYDWIREMALNGLKKMK